MNSGAVRRLLLTCSLAGLLAACGSDGKDGEAGTPGAPGAPGSNGLSAALAITAEPAGLNCASGGSRVDSGMDENANGQLDASEVSSTQYVCSFTGGLNSLVETRDEPVGANCPSGGKQFVAGLDANSNGVLDAGEINSSGYVCNGSQSGAGVRSLTAVNQEPAGANCPSGGVKIDSGSDANDNDTLDPAEITGTQFVCNGASATNTLIRTDLEAAGANCAHGGTRISAGPDTNANGTLEPGEATAVAYSCNGAPGPGVTWEHVTGTAVQAAGNRGYLADNDDDEVVVTLPAAPAIGEIIQINGFGAGGWRIAQNAGQRVATPGLNGEVGIEWQPHAPDTGWLGVASSSDGLRLVAASVGDLIYTSTDGGVSWTGRDSPRAWRAVASSSDGQRLVAVVTAGQVYTSVDGGINWTARELGREWQSVASSADGLRLVAVEYDGQIHISTDGGVNWTPHGPVADWFAVASSADGQQLIAAEEFGYLHTSSDGGATWTTRGPERFWGGVASSADGQRLVAAPIADQLYVSDDAGVTWTARESSRIWAAVTSSADGRRLLAASANQQLFHSNDGGVTWRPRESNRQWIALASSADGQRIAAAEFDGHIYTSAPQPRDSTTTGGAGTIIGRQYATISLQYAGDDEFVAIDSGGDLIVE